MTVLQADWPVEAIRPDNLDRGRKTHAINSHVLERGGGLLMFLDADDWVDARLVETACEAGLGLARLPVSGCYVVNTSDNHPETHGPHAQWRGQFNQAVNHVGRPIDQVLAARFGLALDALRPAALR